VTAAGRPSTPRRGTAGARYGPSILIFLFGLVLWEAVVRVFDIKGFLLPKPTAIATAFSEEWRFISGAAWVTLQEAVGGFLIGSALGVVIALATARWKLAAEGALPLAIAINSAPIVALAPIFNAWFGSTNPVSKMAVVAVMVFFPVMINMVRGLRLVDPAELELMRSYAASDLQILRNVRIPNALPFLFTGLKIGAVLSLIGAIVAEYFGGPVKALGVYILQQSAGTRLAEAWSGIIVGTAIGIALYVVIVIVERLAMPWHVSVRETQV
jgi:NitT/TauT family transport system permease protein